MNKYTEKQLGEIIDETADVIRRVNDMAARVDGSGYYDEGAMWVASKLSRDYEVLCVRDPFEGRWFVNAKSLSAARERLTTKP